ncbi:hypothetical protein MRS44_009678 [Fusarium solani]|uniref:uncharacterized protein n=1 Tax=Fusarium solani TaxID=169388 RepID=UPI0032C3E598|nr:hypothetical protein MRS44_009678 [Fusarium solani]
MTESIQGLKQLLEQDFHKKIEIMKAEFQLEFTKLGDRMAEEVARTTAQMAQELSQAREVRSELEHTRLQLDTMTGAANTSCWLWEDQKITSYQPWFTPESRTDPLPVDQG